MVEALISMFEYKIQLDQLKTINNWHTLDGRSNMAIVRGIGEPIYIYSFPHLGDQEYHSFQNLGDQECYSFLQLGKVCEFFTIGWNKLYTEE